MFLQLKVKALRLFMNTYVVAKLLLSGLASKCSGALIKPESAIVSLVQLNLAKSVCCSRKVKLRGQSQN